MAIKPIIIVGAGFAGLTAALELHRAGQPVIVLEARSRVGGRVYTLRDFDNGRCAEAGGELIDANHRRVLAMAAQFGLPLETVPGMDAWFSWLALDGRLGADDDVSVWGVRLDEEVAKIEQALAELGERVSDPTNPQQAVNAAELDRMPVMAWLESLDVHPLAKKGFAARLRAEFLVEPAGHSTLDLARWGKMVPAQEEATYHIRGGNDRLAQAIAGELPDLRLDSRVTAVRQEKAGVQVSYASDGRSIELAAEEVVLAVPPGPMREIQFDPPLPPAYREMLAALRLGPVTKVILEYKRPFWDEASWSGLLLTDLPMNCIWLTAGGQAGEGGMLTVYTGGKPAADYSAMSDEDRVATVLAQVESLFPGSSVYLKSSRTMAWLNEPLTQGGYLYFPPGSVTAYWNALRQPFGRLHFAGEHTAVYQGYMEGAIESGQRAAAEILA
ncbi:MAG: FAD-dependent oxidoreductase [Candidatus Promineifilaceae bacterium]